MAGRTAYKSEDRITEGSAKKFVDAMMKSNHGAVLEHGTVYLTVPLSYHEEPAYFNEVKLLNYSCRKYMDNPHTRFNVKNNILYVTTNLRVIFENDWMNDLQYLSEPTEYHEKRVTAKFICSRSIAQEITRHRVFSFLMESQRYISYNKEKFGNCITIIIPE